MKNKFPEIGDANPLEVIDLLWREIERLNYNANRKEEIIKEKKKETLLIIKLSMVLFLIVAIAILTLYFSLNLPSIILVAIDIIIAAEVALFSIWWKLK